MKHNFSYVLHTQYSIHVMKSYTITIGKNNCCNKLMREIIRTESVVFVSIMMLCSDHEYEYLNTLFKNEKEATATKTGDDGCHGRHQQSASLFSKSHEHDWMHLTAGRKGGRERNRERYE